MDTGNSKIPLRFRDDLLSRHALAHDASHFLLIPDLVADVRGPEGLASLLKEARRTGKSITFRSGGTSLSGQASGSGILADTRKGFRKIRVLDGGKRLAVEPGVTLRRANAELIRYDRRMGPDPASEIACTIGGIIANNSSGMACGTRENAYATLESAEIVLASGTIIDTSSAQADSDLKRLEPALYESLLRLRDRIRGDRESIATIQRLFSIKNTMGYSVNAFLDFDYPVDILLRLMVGSEGTLGFIAKAVFKTLPLKKLSLTGLIVFSNLEQATNALPLVIDSGADVAELLDEASLRIARSDPVVSNFLRAQETEGESALLVEYRASSDDELESARRTSRRLLAKLGAPKSFSFTNDPPTQNAMWKVRKGLFASVASARRPGEMSILEDIAVPFHNLLPTVQSLQELFGRYSYSNTVIFGHAKDGNLHFLINQSFLEPEEIRRFEAFTADLVELVLAQGGTLKAEHGTGRMMAPYLERQYGKELYDVMRELKSVFDPEGLLNPGVIIETQPGQQISNLKKNPVLSNDGDRCVECGYCEVVCPSQDLSLTPRQRITLQRDMAQAREEGAHRRARELAKSYEYQGIDTCAVDGLCATACPVSIDTGELIKTLRRNKHAPFSNFIWKLAARNWSLTTRTLSRVLTVARRVSPWLASGGSKLLRGLLGKRHLPQWSSDLPSGGKTRQTRARSDYDIVFIASCTGSLFAPSHGLSAEEAFLQICERSGIRVATLEDADQQCCGTPWSSKGFTEGHQIVKERFHNSIRKLPDSVTIVSDGSSCAEGFGQLASGESRVTIVDSVTFTATILERLPLETKLDRLVLHPTCSSEKLGSKADLIAIGRHCADEVIVPKDWGCCGFAGDRGMLFPELTDAATTRMATEIRSIDAQAYASCNRTCEVAMSRSTGKNYTNIIELLERLSRPSPAS